MKKVFSYLSSNVYFEAYFENCVGKHDLYLKNDLVLTEDLKSFFEPLCNYNVENEKFTEGGQQYLEKMLCYNVPHGKLIRGITCVKTFLRMKEEIDSNILEKAFVLGWLQEWLQSLFLVADDIMDRSLERRGQDCWYLVDGVHEGAINDAFILENQMYDMIDHFFGDEPLICGKLNKLFREVTMYTLAGQHEDLGYNRFGSNEPIDFSTYSVEAVDYIHNAKTSMYTVFLPLASAIIAATGEDDGELYNKTKEISSKIGKYFQAQDDFLDVFGDYGAMGKIGRDIEEGKCSWVVCRALELVDEQQMEILQEGYGFENPELVCKVKKLFEEIGLREIYEDYEESVVKGIFQDCEELPDSNVAESFGEIMDLLYHRVR